MPPNWLFWILFNVVVLVLLLLDLGLFQRREHTVQFKEAIAWTAVWVSLAAVFALLIFGYGHYMVARPRPNSQLGLEFITGYLIEESLSVDNLFVFLLIFRYFKTPKSSQHKVLFWGILGAMVMRAIFIIAGVKLINRFHWVVYLLGAFVAFSGFKLLLQKDKEIHPERNPVLKLFRRFVPVTHDYQGNHFFIRRGARLMATPLAIVLLVIESTDVAFATDSIPAVLAVTRDPFVVYTSNVFAILGLRSLYFALAGMIELFHYLHYGLSAILVFIGFKMVLSEFFPIPITVALGVVGGILLLSIAASLLFPATKKRARLEADSD